MTMAFAVSSALKECFERRIPVLCCIAEFDVQTAAIESYEDTRTLGSACDSEQIVLQAPARSSLSVHGL